MPINESLTAARHQAGLSVAQVSERTRIRETIISSIESGDYSACGGDFYARGHIRAIAKAVGADAEPLIQEYDSLHRAPGAVSAVSLEELLSTSAQAPPRRRARLPAVGSLAAAVWVSARSRVNLAAVRDLAAQAYRPLGRRVSWKPVLVLALLVVAGFGLYRLLSGVPPQAVAAPPVAQAGQAQQHARPDSGFPAGHAAPGAIRSRPGAQSRATLRRSVLVAATPVRSHNDLRSPRGRPGTQRPLRHARPRHGHPHRHGRHGHGHGHHERWHHGHRNHGHHGHGHHGHHGHGHHGHGQA
jgi:hypothetical protein